MGAPVIEITTFRVRPGIEERALLAADRLVQDRFMPRQPGFLRRTTARGEDGDWAVVVLWFSADHADAAAANAAGDRWASAFAELLEPGSVVVRRYTELD
jgi:hypothetical protein